jgi:hypothetical protein
VRVSVAGISIDAGDVVWIFDWWARTPIYHRAVFEAWLDDELGMQTRLVTGCGLRTHDREGGLRSADGLPPKHAVKFARPCATCWPELRAQTSLFSRRPGPGATRHEQEALIHGDA